MAQSAPDLASSRGSGEIPPSMEEAGAPGETLLQKPRPASAARPIPRNFVWRLGGGRRTRSEGVVDFRGDMAVDVPVLRASFDPWNNNEQHVEDANGQEGRCKGCSKISMARAAANVIPTAPPHGPIRSECPPAPVPCSISPVVGPDNSLPSPPPASNPHAQPLRTLFQQGGTCA